MIVVGRKAYGRPNQAVAPFVLVLVENPRQKPVKVFLVLFLEPVSGRDAHDVFSSGLCLVVADHQYLASRDQHLRTGQLAISSVLCPQGLEVYGGAIGRQVLQHQDSVVFQVYPEMHVRHFIRPFLRGCDEDIAAFFATTKQESRRGIDKVA